MEKLTVLEMRQIQMDILSSIHAFCTGNNIKYFVTYGSLIGTIRHGGYIPWDDDIDIMFPRPDYERFIASYQDLRFKVVSSENDENYLYLFGKVVDTETILIEDTKRHADMGVNIDLFVLDGLPDDKEKAIKHVKKKTFWLNLYNIKRLAIISKWRAKYKNYLLFLLKVLIIWIPQKLVIRKLNRIFTKYKYEDSEYVTEMVFANPSRIYPKELFEETKLASFEGLEVAIPVGYDAFLKLVYKDYITLPPESERVARHRVTVYRK